MGTSILIKDSFTDTDGTPLENHTPEIGGSWFRDGSHSALITGNKLLAVSVSNERAYHNSQTLTPANDWYYSALITSPNPALFNCWLVVRDNDGKYDKIYIHGGYGGAVYTSEETVEAPGANGIGTYRMEKVGSTLSVYFNGALIANAISHLDVAPITFYLYQDAWAEFDDLEVGYITPVLPPVPPALSVGVSPAIAMGFDQIKKRFRRD